MKKTPRRLARAVVAAALAGLSAVAAVGSALADDLPTVQAEAQRVADNVTALERRLDGLRERGASLRGRIETLTGEIGGLEARILDIERAVTGAQEHYIERAVEAYKGGVNPNRLEMLLSARDLTDLQTVAEATSVAASIDSRRLEELIAAQDRADAAQASLDARKQRLITAQQQIEALEQDMASTVAQRRRELLDLRVEIKRLQREAEEVQAQNPGSGLASVLPPPQSQGPTATADIPPGYASTGVSFEGEASWYGPGFAGNSTANGEIFDPMGMTAANKELPFNTLLFVEYQGRGVVVRINDRGPYHGNRIIDLSQGAAQTIGMGGVGWVRATVVLKQ